MKTLNIFISNACKYGVNYDKIVDCLNKNKDFLWNNTANPMAFENIQDLNETYNILEKQIQKADIVIFASQMYFKHNDIIRFQYDYTKSLGKPMIIIKPWAGEDTPEYFTKDNFPMIEYHSEEIIKEIEKIKIK